MDEINLPLLNNLNIYGFLTPSEWTNNFTPIKKLCRFVFKKDI